MADDNKPKGTPVKLKITGCTVAYQGTNTRGDDYTIHEIAAEREGGEAITDKKLRSFEELPVGELLDLMVVPFKSEQHGLSFTLSRKNKVGTHQRINELQKQVEELVGKLGRVENWIRQQVQPAPTPITTQAPATQEAIPVAHSPEHAADLDARFGADAPF